MFGKLVDIGSYFTKFIYHLHIGFDMLLPFKADSLIKEERDFPLPLNVEEAVLSRLPSSGSLYLYLDSLSYIQSM